MLTSSNEEVRKKCTECLHKAHNIAYGLHISTKMQKEFIALPWHKVEKKMHKVSNEQLCEKWKLMK
jgi:L-rhamnose mutarotase